MDLWQMLKTECRPIVLYGMGNGAQLVLDRLEKIGISPVGIFASNGFVRGQSFCGYTVKQLNELEQQFPDMVILVCFGSGRGEVLAEIKRLSARHTLYCPDVPVYGNHIFDDDFYARYQPQLQTVYRSLSDDLSRTAFQNIIRFKLSGKPEYLYDIECHEDPFSPLGILQNERFLDLGAYRGDTAERFLKIDPLAEVLAIEPERHNYKKLSEFCKTHPGILPMRAAVSENCGEISVSGSGRGVAVAKQGEKIPCVTVDSLDFRPTVIKMDVEGNESAVIEGAADTIRRCRPKMMVAAYHRSEDLFALPLKVLSLCPEYRVLLRHYPHNLAWDTDFYFI